MYNLALVTKQGTSMNFNDSCRCVLCRNDVRAQLGVCDAVGGFFSAWALAVRVGCSGKRECGRGSWAVVARFGKPPGAGRTR